MDAGKARDGVGGTSDFCSAATPTLAADMTFAAMFVLILASALFSGGEAAMFSLTPRSRRAVAKAGWAGRLADRLLDDPESLLTAVLFWNLLVNVTYFALAAISASRLIDRPGLSAAVTVGSLVAIIFFSEMLPKSVALLSPVRSSVLVAPALGVATGVLRPVLPVLAAINRGVGRLVAPNLEVESEMELEDIQRAIDLGTDDAALLRREKLAMRNLVALTDIRADEMMRPRSRCRLITTDQLNDPVSLMDSSVTGEPFVLVPRRDEGGVDDDDEITHAVTTRTMRPSQWSHPADVAEEVIFVPWSAKVSQVLQRLDDDGRSVAVVFDEFGGWIGAMTIDDILRYVLVRDAEATDDAGGGMWLDHGDGRFRVAGNFGFRSVVRRLELGDDVDTDGVSTLSGWFQRETERLPRVGDTARLGEYVVAVAEDGDDAVWFDLSIAPETAGGEGA